MKKIASPTRETTYTGRLSVKADYAGRPVLLVRDFFPAFDNHDAFEIVEDRIINSAYIDSIPSVFIQVLQLYTRSRHCVKKINRDSFLFFYPLDTKFCFVASFFRNEGGKKKRRGKSELFISKTSGIKVHRRQATIRPKARCYSIIANFFNEHIDTVDDEMWARSHKPDPD